MPERSDPMSERLSRFTPNPAGLDRDAILFAAGRQSARGIRIWPVVAGLLVVSQIATLIALWPNSTAPVVPTPSANASQRSPDSSIPSASPPTDVWSAGSRPDVLQSEPNSTNSEFVTSGPPLTVGSSSRFD
jgi:hypothetical protein